MVGKDGVKNRAMVYKICPIKICPFSTFVFYYTSEEKKISFRKYFKANKIKIRKGLRCF